MTGKPFFYDMSLRVGTVRVRITADLTIVSAGGSSAGCGGGGTADGDDEACPSHAEKGEEEGGRGH